MAPNDGTHRDNHPTNDKQRMWALAVEVVVATVKDFIQQPEF